MTEQWIRNCSLVVAAPNSGTASFEGQSVEGGGLQRGIELGALRIVFQVTHESTETPKGLVARIFNVAPNTATIIGGSKEFTRVILKVGYGYPEDNPRLETLFDGEIKQVRRGRVNATDTYVDVFAASSDRANNYAVIKKTLAAGYTQKDVNDAVAAAFGEHGVKHGYTAGMGEQKAPRGRVLWGMARNAARDVAYSNNTVWNMPDGAYEQVPIAESTPDEAVVITARTGMIGMPQQTIDGIVVRCLMNPAIKAERRIKLDNKSIQEARIGIAYRNTDPAGELRPKMNADGIYKVLFVEHMGDTRGQEWYTEAACMAIDGTMPVGQRAIQAIRPAPYPPTPPAQP